LAYWRAGVPVADPPTNAPRRVVLTWDDPKKILQVAESAFRATLVRGQDPSGLAFGDRAQRHHTDLARDITGLIGKGVRVSVVAEDLAERGLRTEDLVAGLETIPRAALPDLFEKFDQVWHW